MKIGDGISSYYRAQNGSQPSGGAASHLPVNAGGGGQRSQAPTVSIGASASSSSLSSALWLSMADRLESDSGSLSGEPKTKGAADEFMEWSTMTLAEKIRAQLLGGKGLTEEELAHMDADQRAAIEAEIKEAIKRQLTGVDDKGNKTAADSV
ncbi:hypothetical protein [Rhizobium sp. Root482]|uniref:hypothetical protein n=1 Tax=Rhizobium sp. Root482 TaxID=1736543 RepID=UPI0006FC4689|nr:hypothetical protein [Rhizobium sp. Root482]KQY19798.1 hypothetical protein ASD31_05185 [Rhizobium sp. Root482]